MTFVIGKEGDPSYNMAELFTQHLNALLRQKSIFRDQEDLDGWIRILVDIWDLIKPKIEPRVKKVEFVRIDRDLENIYRRAKSIDNDFILYKKMRRLDYDVMFYLWKFNFIMPRTISADPMAHLNKKYGLKNEQEQ